MVYHKERNCGTCEKKFIIKNDSQICSSVKRYVKSWVNQSKEEQKNKKVLSIDDVLKIGRQNNIVGYANIVKFIEDNGIS